MDPNNKKRVLGFLDKNVCLPKRHRTSKAALITISEGPENSGKRRKIVEESREIIQKQEKKEKVVVREGQPELPQRNLQEEVTRIVESDVHVQSKQLENKQIDFVLPYLEDVILMEFQLEARLNFNDDFCVSGKSSISAVHRELIFEWLLAMQLSLKFSNEVLYLAVILMDVFLNKEKIRERELHGVAAGSLWLADKFLRGVLKSKSILKYCDKLANEDLRRYEKRVFAACDYNLQYPNAYSILHFYMLKINGLPLPPVEYHASCFLQELILLHMDYVHQPVNVRTGIALLTAMYLFRSNKIALFLSLLDKRTQELVYEGYLNLLQILRIGQNNEEFIKKSILVRKYSSKEYMHVSQNPAMNPDSACHKDNKPFLESINFPFNLQ